MRTVAAGPWVRKGSRVIKVCSGFDGGDRFVDDERGQLVLDKTLPYYNVIMKRRPGLPMVAWPLPVGFSWAGFAPGQAIDWGYIEASVGEFATTKEAVEYFQRTYLPKVEELPERVVFVRAENGEAVGTVTSWWNDTGTRRDPSLHWLAVVPEYQSLGLGKALVSECLRRLALLEGDRDVFLHTQTWSYRAIAIYLNAGFEFVEDESFGNYPNDYELAISVLRKVLPGLGR